MGGNSFLDALSSLASMDFTARPSKLTDGVSPFGERQGQHRTMLGGDQWQFAFANGYGASVIRNSGSYGHEDGLWELAVLDTDGHLAYETPITDDVEGRLTEDDVIDLLERIEALD